MGDLLPILNATGSASQHAGGERRRLRVALVNMPWARADAPSIQCGLLQSLTKAAGHDCDVWYVNLELAAKLGPEAYALLADAPQDRLNLIGEWLFSYAAFGEVTSAERYIADYPEVEKIWQQATGNCLEHMIDFRRNVLPDWVDALAARPGWSSYDVVGFSSTFWQNTSGLALGRKLKERHPDLPLVYGGANFDGEMGQEFIRRIPWIDYVVTGEGDVALPRLLDALARGAAGGPIPGVLHQPAGVPDLPEGPRLDRLDGLPAPDYHDYFAALGELGQEAVVGKAEVKLPVEFSRGCWWGEKHHCTFCGLNALGMAYRAKPPDHAIAELASLLTEYPAVQVEAVDNILDMKYISTMCAKLAERRWDISLFFEVKANLTREQLDLLHKAGVRRIQPGIESLSTNVLDLMRKGSSMLLNLRLLKWARYYGISVSWNLLGGFPGETDEDYAGQLKLIPLLYHLQPPDATARIWLERFSPFYNDPSLGLTGIRPRSSYGHIYPAGIDHSKIAYFFDYEARDVVSEETFAQVQAATAKWAAAWARVRKPSLIYRSFPGRLSILDRRKPEGRQAVLTGWQAQAYEACGDSPRTVARVRDQLAESGSELTEREVSSLLRRFCRSGVMVSEAGRYLSLAIPENPGW
ncbi:MAG TPA: RiPP maturation radical SAM C-methyltransferase [Streptosporangiaceae bacterium]|nr:RiPP maturation radical SAM C-methyltransferase [Streptosporangiaceae bacterium]